ncbi:glypican-1b [Synchiropus picturatus]
MESYLVAALSLCCLTAPSYGDKGTSKARSCSDIRQFYNGKGFPLDGVPLSEISGEHLRICPQGYTCCTSDMEENLATLSRREIEGVLKDAGRSVQYSLTGLHKTFDGYFMELLNHSAAVLHQHTSTWGSFYTQNSQVFSDLYTDLRLYYRGSNINLEDVLNDFWARLLERLFYQANRQYYVGDDYLECVSKQIETLRPFGDIPRDVKLKVTRTFLAGRSFVQGLFVSGEVVRKVSQVQLSPPCMRAIMRMTYCPHCRGVPSARPCVNYCINVMKGCLANQADLNSEWRHLAETMIQVAERFNGPSGADVVLLSLPDQISEAVITMLENIEMINGKLYQSCGNLRQAGSGASDVDDLLKKAKLAREDQVVSSSSKALDKMVSDITFRMRDMQPYWVSLPAMICSDRVASGAGAEERCWNGMSRARYLPEVMSDGLASQINNPEVDIDITKPDMSIRQQIMQLKVMTHRLKNAYNGNDVDFQDTSDDASGSGSGMCTDEMCSRSPRIVIPVTTRPLVYNPPKEKKIWSRNSAMTPRPVVTIHLLSLLLWLLLR